MTARLSAAEKAHAPKDVFETRDAYRCGICRREVVRFSAPRARWEHVKEPCENHPTMGGHLVRLIGTDGKALRGFRMIACGECRARMTREGFTVVRV